MITTSEKSNNSPIYVRVDILQMAETEDDE